MPQAPVQQAVAEYRHWEQQALPALERLVVALKHMPLPRNNEELVAQLIAIRDDIVQSQQDLIRTMNANGDIVANLERHVKSLESRIRELEADNRAWQQEYEPDADPRRPAFFSNLRHAFAALFHHAS